MLPLRKLNKEREVFDETSTYETQYKAGFLKRLYFLFTGKIYVYTIRAGQVDKSTDNIVSLTMLKYRDINMFGCAKFLVFIFLTAVFYLTGAVLSWEWNPLLWKLPMQLFIGFLLSFFWAQVLNYRRQSEEDERE